MKEKISNIRNEKIKIEGLLKNLDVNSKTESPEGEVFPGNIDENEENYEELVKELERVKKINKDILKGCV